MATYPTAKVKRPRRTKLGKGQHPNTTPVVATAVAVGSTAANNFFIEFSAPVTFTGPINYSGTVGDQVSAQIQNTQKIEIFTATTVATKTCTIPNNPEGVTPVGGGQITGGTFTF